MKLFLFWRLERILFVNRNNFFFKKCHLWDIFTWKKQCRSYANNEQVVGKSVGTYGSSYDLLFPSNFRSSKFDVTAPSRIVKKWYWNIQNTQCLLWTSSYKILISWFWTEIFLFVVTLNQISNIRDKWKWHTCS